MPRYIAFLRAINVGGHIVKMYDLRVLFESLQFKGVETFIASGNVIFETASKSSLNLPAKIEAHLHKALGYEVATFVRTDLEVAAIANYKPFRESNVKSAGAFCVGFMAQPLEREGEKTLMRFRSDIDDFHVNGTEIYWLCQKRQSESNFSNFSFEKALKRRATFRGMNTILRLAAKYPPSNMSR